MKSHSAGNLRPGKPSASRSSEPLEIMMALLPGELRFAPYSSMIIFLSQRNKK
jgi:hypothetical protein